MPRASKSPARASKSPPHVRPAASLPVKTASIVWGDYVPHEHVSSKNITNAILCALVLVPSYLAVYHLFGTCDAARPQGDACKLAIESPISFANVLFFFNVTVGFWLIGLVQRSFWLIDPYWTLIPPLLGHLYRAHPNASFNADRSALMLGLLWAWSIRLTHSYFRREEWKFGQREDWRYTKMARDMPRLWPLASFFAVGLAQQPMLVGITLPAAVAHTSALPLSALDALAFVGCVSGLLIACSADDTLYAYMNLPRPLAHAVEPVLQSGLWKYSRHPNYFGEQLWWWSFALFAGRLGGWWAFGGTAFNSIILATVTVMTEERMLANWTPERAALYRAYMKRTSPCVPWFPRGRA